MPEPFSQAMEEWKRGLGSRSSKPKIDNNKTKENIPKIKGKEVFKAVAGAKKLVRLTQETAKVIMKDKSQKCNLQEKPSRSKAEAPRNTVPVKSSKASSSSSLASKSVAEPQASGSGGNSSSF